MIACMDGKYLAVFCEGSGRTLSDVGDMYLDLYDGAPLDKVNWMGRQWTRISGLRGGVAHYLPSGTVVP